ncbi:MAG: hypothetical protein NTX28_00005 [Novosphingobium sp.]|nr:hypothetical protein [Novosphingobium sp.]
MTDLDGLPAWARRRLARRFERGGNARILRCMSVPVGGGPDANDAASATEDAPTDDLIAFARRPEAVAAHEHPRAGLTG